MVLSDAGAIKTTDGEPGEGAAILKMPERAGLADHIVVVWRRSSGRGDRFAPVVTALRARLAALSATSK